jgi:glyoxylase-like metal-dependent hydrolase (beta-lactamase superfamily II)
VPGRIFHLGALSVETWLTSGQVVGGVTYFIRGLAKPIAIVRDSIFAGSMGGGKVLYADALRDNWEQVLTLPEETIICPGHGYLTIVAE